MTHFRPIALTAALALSAASHAQLTLVWADEFDGTSLNSANWEAQIGTGTAYGLPAGWGNNELQYYTSRAENIQVSGGQLQLIARQESFSGRPYTSARIRTLNRQQFLYGRIEARIQVPEGSGLWPAFWMLPTGSPYGGWAASGEIDIMESVNIANSVYGTLHFGGGWPNNTSAGTNFFPGFNLAQGFHTYAVEWDPDQIRWYLDGNRYHTRHRGQWFSSAAPGNDAAPFDIPFHLLLNVAVGGNFPGNPNGSASFPQIMRVDWVRAYAFEQTPFGGTPHAIPGTIQAEDFDTGYGGLAYQDSDGPNNGNAYRDTAVDIEAKNGGGFNVGWIGEDEWLEYTVNIAATGQYVMNARVASPTGGGLFSVSIDGIDLAGNVPVPNTGGWQAFTDVPRTVTLPAGTHVLRFSNAGAADRMNLDELRFVAIAPPCPADLTTTGSTNGIPDGQVNGSDFTYYLSLFAAGAPTADLTTTGSTNGIPDGQINGSDFTYFLSLFAAGCP